MSYIVILMSFQTIYSLINYGGSEHSRPLLDQNFEKFRAPPSVELSEPPPFNARKYFGAPPLTSSSPPLGIINVLSLTFYAFFKSIKVPQVI
jgi:hypothetical protein